jgi:2-hydroxyglutarate dehydrogenase
MPDTTGIRAKRQKPGEGFKDFVIREESDKGYPGFFNLIGIESPGLTASLAIAEFVKKLLA